MLNRNQHGLVPPPIGGGFFYAHTFLYIRRKDTTMSSVRTILSDIVNDMQATQAYLRFYDEAEALNSLIDGVKESGVLVAVNSNFGGRVLPTETSKLYHAFTLQISFIALPNSDSQESAQATEQRLVQAQADFMSALFRHIAWYKVPTNSQQATVVSFNIDEQKGNARAMALSFSQEFTFDLMLPTFCSTL